jgi:hypothetical protein
MGHQYLKPKMATILQTEKRHLTWVSIGATGIIGSRTSDWDNWDNSF